MKLEYILGLAVAGWALYEWMKPASGTPASSGSLTDIQIAYAAQILKDAGVQPTTENVQAAATIASANPTSTAYINAKQSLINQGGVL